MTSPFERLSGYASDVAPWLLGAFLTSIRDGHAVTVRVTEVEAYEGSHDPASHAYRGPTARNAVMFGPAGHLYVYFVHGMHWCANVVCGPPGESSAILVRAGEVVDGIELASARRPTARRESELARGPARLAQALALTGSDGGLDLLDPASAVRLSLPAAPSVRFETGPRVGVGVAADVALRFWLPGEASVSAYKAGGRIRTGRDRHTGPP